MTYRTEFPDFQEADMPAIPEGFTDRSWKNDASPHFEHDGLGLSLFLDYADGALSEFPELRASGDHKRFFLMQMDRGEAEGEWFMPADNDAATIAYTDDWNEILAAILGSAFAAECREQFAEEELADIRHRNATPEYADACATHDFADANMVMLEAFKATFGREPKFLEGTDAAGNHSPEGETDMALWNAAWDWAKRVHLTEGASDGDRTSDPAPKA